MGTTGRLQWVSFDFTLMITYVFLTPHQIPAPVTGHTSVNTVTTQAVPHEIRGEARSFCQSLGGDLVKITSAEENEFVLYLARKFAGNGKPAWIGLFWDPKSKAYY